MQTILKLITISASSIFLFTACTSKNLEHQGIKNEAKVSIKQVASTFLSKLQEKVKEGGLENAALFCSTNANNLSAEIAQTLPYGVSVKRITNKPRNIKNQASLEQLLILEELKNKIENNEKSILIVKQLSAKHFQVYKPILITGACLNCHGEEPTRDKKAYDIISSNYPQDKAINYKLGDLRGAFLVDIIKN